MKQVTVTCDSCGKDLARTGNMEDWRLALVNESIPSWGGFVTCMAIEPKIVSDAHFCGVKCLKEWVSKRT